MYDAAVMSSTVERKMPTEIEQLRDLFRGQQNVKASDMITCCWNASSETCNLPGCVASVNPTAWADPYCCDECRMGEFAPTLARVRFIAQHVFRL